MTQNRWARLSWAALVTGCYIFLLAPIVVVLIISFDSRPYLSFPPESYSLDAYAAVLNNKGFVRGALNSLIVGVITGLLALALGVLLSLALVRRKFPGKDLVRGVVLAPFVVPNIVLAVGILLVLAPWKLLDSYLGLVIAHLAITIPYVVRTVSASLMGVDIRVEEAARVHGASPSVVFRRITLPSIRPGLIAGGAIAFLVSFDESTISLFITRTRTTTLPVELFKYLELKTDPQVAALSVLLILVSVIVVVFIERLVGLRQVLR